MTGVCGLSKLLQQRVALPSGFLEFAPRQQQLDGDGLRLRERAPIGRLLALLEPVEFREIRFGIIQSVQRNVRACATDKSVELPCQIAAFSSYSERGIERLQRRLGLVEPQPLE